MDADDEEDVESDVLVDALIEELVRTRMRVSFLCQPSKNEANPADYFPRHS